MYNAHLAKTCLVHSISLVCAVGCSFLDKVAIALFVLQIIKNLSLTVLYTCTLTFLTSKQYASTSLKNMYMYIHVYHMINSRSRNRYVKLYWYAQNINTYIYNMYTHTHYIHVHVHSIQFSQPYF